MAEQQTRTLKDQYMLRLPDGMRDRIRDAAAANNRSMNAEIVATLEEKYPAPVEVNPDGVMGHMQRILDAATNTARLFEIERANEKFAALGFQFDYSEGADGVPFVEVTNRDGGKLRRR